MGVIRTAVDVEVASISAIGGHGGIAVALQEPPTHRVGNLIVRRLHRSKPIVVDLVRQQVREGLIRSSSGEFGRPSLLQRLSNPERNLSAHIASLQMSWRGSQYRRCPRLALRRPTKLGSCIV